MNHCCISTNELLNFAYKVMCFSSFLLGEWSEGQGVKTWAHRKETADLAIRLVACTPLTLSLHQNLYLGFK